MIEFLQNNYKWIAAILTALAAIIGAILKIFKKGGKSHKQKVGDISDSTVININGDLEQKQKS